MKLGLIVFALAALIAAPIAAAQSPAEIAASVTITRDAYGVPHIEGPTDASVVFGLAYAQAEDNFPHLEDNFIRALGRAAEMHGERAVRDDQMVAALEIVPLAQAEYARATPRMRALYDAYAAGLNYHVARANEPRALLNHFEPWFPLALIRYKYHLLEFVGYAGLDEENYRPVAAITPPERPQGSNMWAIAPQRSASGAAMLFINPHVGFFGPAQYYESHLISGEGWNISGVGRYGFPFPYMGHTENLGWSHTDNYPDIGDLYIEHFDNAANPMLYRYGDGYREARDTLHDIAVRDGNATHHSRFVVRRTHHGPIVSYLDGQPLSIRLAMLSEGGWFDQWYAMSKARNFRQFRQALTRGAIPYMNVVYADRAGNIFYAYNGSVPRRREGFDYRRPVDGSDPRVEWRGYHRFSELPQVLNPRTGYVQNTNSSPFFTTTTGNPNPRRFPSYMIGPEDDNPRARVSRQILESKPLFTFENWTTAATDTSVYEAQRMIPRLVEAFGAYRQTTPEQAAEIAPLVDELAAWDQRGAIGSVAMTIFVRWYEKYRRDSTMSGDPPSEAPAVWFGFLWEVRRELMTQFGDWRVPWGDVNRLQRRHWSGDEAFDDNAPSLAVPGGPGWVGIVFNYYTGAPTPAGRRYGRLGNSYVSVVEFGERTQARSIVYFGQSGRPESPHYFDQAPLYARGEFKPAPTTSEEVAAASVRRYHPGE